MKQKTLEEKLEMIKFNGVDLVRAEYDALQEIASKYGKGKTAEEYFRSSSDESDVYLEIENEHVTRLDMTGQGLKEIPPEVEKLEELKILYLGQNQISQIRDLHLPNLEQLDIYNNGFDWGNSENKRIYYLLSEKEVAVIVESEKIKI